MRMVITGTGVVSPLGSEPGEFCANLDRGRTGFGPISQFATDPYRCNMAGQVSGFDPTRFVNPRSIKKYDRIQLLTLGAAEQAWESAGLETAAYPPEELGIVLGSTYGYIDSVGSFYRESLQDGPAYVSPIHFANTVMNAPAGKIAIRHHITGLCSTVATGEASFIDALAYARDFIENGQCKAVLVGGGSALCEGIFMGFYHTHTLSGSRRGDDWCCAPFDCKGNGITLGEGAGMVVLESRDAALARGAAILAEVKGFGSRFLAPTAGDEAARVRSAVQAMEAAIDEAGLGAEEISLVSASANSTPGDDRVEALAVKHVFNGTGAPPAVSALKSMTGECLDASGAFQVVAALHTLHSGRIPPTVNLEEPLEAGLDYVRGGSVERETKAVLVNCFSCSGKKTALVVTAG